MEYTNIFGTCKSSGTVNNDMHVRFRGDAGVSSYPFSDIVKEFFNCNVKSNFDDCVVATLELQGDSLPKDFSTEDMFVCNIKTMKALDNVGACYDIIYPNREISYIEVEDAIELLYLHTEGMDESDSIELLNYINKLDDDSDIGTFSILEYFKDLVIKDIDDSLFNLKYVLTKLNNYGFTGVYDLTNVESKLRFVDDLYVFSKFMMYYHVAKVANVDILYFNNKLAFCGLIDDNVWLSLGEKCESLWGFSCVKGTEICELDNSKDLSLLYDGSEDCWGLDVYYSIG